MGVCACGVTGHAESPENDWDFMLCSQMGVYSCRACGLKKGLVG